MIQNGRPAVPVIWLKVSPYIHPWAEEVYGSKVRIHGRRVLHLMGVHGVRDLLREEVDEDAGLDKPCERSMSAARMNVYAEGMKLNAPTMERLYGLTREQLSCYIPVAVGEYMLTLHGVMRPWNVTMQLRSQVANALNNALYGAFWSAVYIYDQAFRKDTDAMGVTVYDKDMLASFCEDYGIPSIYLEDLRNHYQRMKRKGRLAKYVK